MAIRATREIAVRTALSAPKARGGLKEFKATQGQLAQLVLKVMKATTDQLVLLAPKAIKEILVPRVNVEILEKKVPEENKVSKAIKVVMGYKVRAVKMVPKVKPEPWVFLVMSVQKVTVETKERMDNMATLVLKEIEEKWVTRARLAPKETQAPAEKRVRMVEMVPRVNKASKDPKVIKGNREEMAPKVNKAIKAKMVVMAPKASAEKMA